MITFLIEMLESPNFGHMTKSTMLFEWRNKNLLVTTSTKIVTSKPLFQNTFILRRPGGDIFANIIKIITRFIKKIFKDSRRVKRVRNYSQNGIYTCIFWYSKICWFPEEKCWCQQNSWCVSRDWYIFWIFFSYGITVLSFIFVGYVWQILGRRPLCPLHLEQPQKCQSWIGLNLIFITSTTQSVYFPIGLPLFYSIPDNSFYKFNF